MFPNPVVNVSMALPTPGWSQHALALLLVDLSPVDESLARPSDNVRNDGWVTIDSEEGIFGKGDLRLLIVLVDPDLDDRQEGTPFFFTSLDSPLDLCSDLGGQMWVVAGGAGHPGVFGRHFSSMGQRVTSGKG
jgi:hypothetical protein